MNQAEVSWSLRSTPRGQHHAEIEGELGYVGSPGVPAFRVRNETAHRGLSTRNVLEAREPTLRLTVNAVTDDSLDLYLQEIGRIPLLTADEEIQLARRVEMGDKKAKDRMVRSNLRLVVHIAKNCHAQEMELLDLIQEGNLGLIRAVERYDHRKGFKFSTYATWGIRRAILRAIETQDRAIRIPMPLVGNINTMRRIESRTLQETGREISNDELARTLGIEPTDVPNLRKIAQRVLSLETPIGDASHAVVADFLEDSNTPDPHEATFDLMKKESLHRALRGLERRQRKILELRFGLKGDRPCTLEEIGRRFQVSRECIRQIEGQALKRLGAAQEIQAVRQIPRSSKLGVA